MAHDLIIRNGTVHDGTGAAAVEADIAIDGDRVTAIGDLADATAESEIDATGLAVTPGFVDLHTHMDAQIGWDPFMTSSSWHGDLRRHVRARRSRQSVVSRGDDGERRGHSS